MNLKNSCRPLASRKVATASGMPSLVSAIQHSFAPARAAPRRPVATLDEQLARAFGDSEESHGEQPRGRYRTSCTVAERRQWLQALQNLREERTAAGHKGLGAGLTEFIWRQWPATRNNKQEYERLRKFCYNLLSEATAKRLSTPKAPSQGNDRKRRRVSGGGRRPLCEDISIELLQWFVDTVTGLQAGRLCLYFDRFSGSRLVVVRVLCRSCSLNTQGAEYQGPCDEPDVGAPGQGDSARPPGSVASAP